MCGIFGIVSKEEKPLGPILTEAGKRLAYRGYDSVGAAVFTDNSIDLRKDIGKVEEVNEKLNFSEMKGNRGIIQLRWATFGAPAQVNAQPFMDCKQEIVGAENGNIVNSIQLQEILENEGHTIQSTNDGEICVHVVAKHMRAGKTMLESIQLAYKELKGDYALIFFNKVENKIYAIKKGSGLVVAVTENEAYCSSDIPSILPLTNEIISMQDGDIVVLEPGKAEFYRADTGEKVERKAKVHKETMESAQKGGYDHFMLKEIHEQSDRARDLIDLLNESKFVEPFVSALKSAREIYFVGCGTSYHACQLGSYYFNKIAII